MITALLVASVVLSVLNVAFIIFTTHYTYDEACAMARRIAAGWRS